MGDFPQLQPQRLRKRAEALARGRWNGDLAQQNVLRLIQWWMERAVNGAMVVFMFNVTPRPSLSLYIYVLYDILYIIYTYIHVYIYTYTHTYTSFWIKWGNWGTTWSYEWSFPSTTTWWAKDWFRQRMGISQLNHQSFGHSMILRSVIKKQFAYIYIYTWDHRESPCIIGVPKNGPSTAAKAAAHTRWSNMAMEHDQLGVYKLPQT